AKTKDRWPSLHKSSAPGRIGTQGGIENIRRPIATPGRAFEGRGEPGVNPIASQHEAGNRCLDSRPGSGRFGRERGRGVRLLDHARVVQRGLGERRLVRFEYVAGEAY